MARYFTKINVHQWKINMFLINDLKNVFVSKMDIGFNCRCYRKYKITWECEAFFASRCHNFCLKDQGLVLNCKKALQSKLRFWIDQNWLICSKQRVNEINRNFFLFSNWKCTVITWLKVRYLYPNSWIKVPYFYSSAHTYS